MVSMKRFYEPNLMTCLKSGCFLFAISLIIIATAFWSRWVLLTGVIGIMAFALIMGRSLARAGLDAMLVKLSQFHRLKGAALIGVAILFEGVLFVFAVPITIAAFDNINIEFVRLASLAAATAFLPLSVSILATMVREPV